MDSDSTQTDPYEVALLKGAQRIRTKITDDYMDTLYGSRVVEYRNPTDSDLFSIRQLVQDSAKQPVLGSLNALSMQLRSVWSIPNLLKQLKGLGVPPESLDKLPPFVVVSADVESRRQRDC